MSRFLLLFLEMPCPFGFKADDDDEPEIEEENNTRKEKASAANKASRQEGYSLSHA